MNGKLTLTLEKSLIEKAKTHCKNMGKSPSQVVSEFFLNLAPASEKQETADTPTVRELRGCFTEKQNFFGKKPAKKSTPKTQKE